MPMKASYYTVDGEIIGQEVSGTRLDYLTDALGSVVTVVDQNQTVTHTARYKPYGADLATTGTAVAFGWVGSLGYRRTGLSNADHYVRARHYGDDTARWRSVDQYWPRELAYGYVSSNPVTAIDPTGNALWIPLCIGLFGLYVVLLPPSDSHVPAGCRRMSADEATRADNCRAILSSCGMSPLLPKDGTHYICRSMDGDAYGETDPDTDKITFDSSFGSRPFWDSCTTLLHESLHATCGARATKSEPAHQTLTDWADYLAERCKRCGSVGGIDLNPGSICDKIRRGEGPPPSYVVPCEGSDRGIA